MFFNHKEDKDLLDMLLHSGKVAQNFVVVVFLLLFFPQLQKTFSSNTIS